MRRIGSFFDPVTLAFGHYGRPFSIYFEVFPEAYNNRIDISLGYYDQDKGTRFWLEFDSFQGLFKNPFFLVEFLPDPKTSLNLLNNISSAFGAEFDPGPLKTILMFDSIISKSTVKFIGNQFFRKNGVVRIACSVDDIKIIGNSMLSNIELRFVEETKTKMLFDFDWELDELSLIGINFSPGSQKRDDKVSRDNYVRTLSKMRGVDSKGIAEAIPLLMELTQKTLCIESPEIVYAHSKKVIKNKDFIYWKNYYLCTNYK